MFLGALGDPGTYSFEDHKVDKFPVFGIVTCTQ